MGRRFFLFPIFGNEVVVAVIRYELPSERRCGDEVFCEVLQGSRDLVYRYDFVEDRFLYVSESVYTLFGFGLGEFVKFGWDDFLGRVHEADSADVSSGEGGVCVREFRWRCKDGEFRWFSDRRTFVFDDSGKVVGVIGCVRNVDEERAVREEAIKLSARIDYMKRGGVVSKVNLTNKEQVVLWGLCRHPLLNDVELAKVLKLKRSTLTAIKNRLNKGNWFRLIYVPNFNKLGCDYAGFFVVA
jgi:PAS domain S-box-containing protein